MTHRHAPVQRAGASARISKALTYSSQLLRNAPFYLLTAWMKSYLDHDFIPVNEKGNLEPHAQEDGRAHRTGSGSLRALSLRGCAWRTGHHRWWIGMCWCVAVPAPLHLAPHPPMSISMPHACSIQQTISCVHLQGQILRVDLIPTC